MADRQESWRARVGRALDIGTDPDDEQDLRVRKRTAVAACLSFMLIASGLALVDLAIGQIAQLILATLQVAALGGALLLYRLNHRLDWFFWIMAVSGMAVLFSSLIPAGGLVRAGTNLIWIILVPLGAVLFLGGRAAVPALLAVIGVVIAAIAIEPYMTAVQSSSIGPIFVAINLVAPAAIALGLVVFIDGERVRAKAESEAVLLNVLPRSIVERIKRGELVIADQHAAVTVVFADLVGFTPLAAQKTASQVVELLNELFSHFDALAEDRGLEKIKTIGDEYMAVAGAPDARSDHAQAGVAFALEMLVALPEFDTLAGERLQLRVGVASGPAVAGVIGQRKFSYDVWGDAVNLASRMQSTGLPGQVQVAETTRALCDMRYEFTPREIDVKGIGPMRAYLLAPPSTL